MIIAIASRKGGVGKTTTSVNLAAALAGRGQRTLLLDLDPQASCSRSLGLARSELAPSIADVLMRNESFERVIRTTAVDGLDLVSSSTDLSSLEESLATYGAREKVLSNKLEPWTEVYDHILIDCPAGLSLLSRAALVAADGFIVPVVPQFLGVEGLNNLVSAAERLSFKNGSRIRFLGVLLTMVDYRTRLTRDSVEQIRGEHGERVFAVEVRINVRLAEAPAYGQTIFEYDDRCVGARAYDLVAQELEMRAVPISSLERAAPARPSLESPTAEAPAVARQSPDRVPPTPEQRPMEEPAEVKDAPTEDDSTADDTPAPARIYAVARPNFS